jgi:hypothetical protein
LGNSITSASIKDSKSSFILTKYKNNLTTNLINKSNFELGGNEISILSDENHFDENEKNSNLEQLENLENDLKNLRFSIEKEKEGKECQEKINIIYPQRGRENQSKFAISNSSNIDSLNRNITCNNILFIL